MTTSNQNNQRSSQDSQVDEQTIDPRDLVSKGGYDKDPREVVENPAVTPQMPEESQDSQAGMERTDRNHP